MTPAAAIGWEFGRRFRWGFSGIAVYLAALGIIRLVVLPRGPPVDLEHDMGMWFLVLGPLTAIFIFLLAVFSFGLDGDLAGRPSIFPRRLFTLPMTTAALAGWPVLYGALAAAGLWLATALFALRPSGLPVPLIWPALFAAAFLIWTQALTWMPYGLRGLRVIAAMLWLTSADAVVMIALEYRIAESRMIAVAIPFVALGYVTALLAVARARRGEAPDWLASARRRRTERLAPFASAERAQFWFEWRLHGKSLPMLVALVAPFELALLFTPDAGRALIIFTLLAAVLTPPFLALFTAATVRDANLTPFLAAQPLTSAALVAAKLKAAFWSAFVSWLLLLLAIPAALALSGTWPVFARAARQVIEIFGVPRAIVLSLLAVAGLLASTWKQLVQSLYVGLSGRAWARRASVAFALTLLCAVGPFLKWLDGSVMARGLVWNQLPAILALLVSIKMCAAAWVVVRLCRSGLLSERALLAGAAGWTSAVLALHALLAWLFSGPLVPSFIFLLLAILGVPLARFSAAPLALAWNRHR